MRARTICMRIILSGHFRPFVRVLVFARARGTRFLCSSRMDRSVNVPQLELIRACTFFVLVFFFCPIYIILYHNMDYFGIFFDFVLSIGQKFRGARVNGRIRIDHDPRPGACARVHVHDRFRMCMRMHKAGRPSIPCNKGSICWGGLRHHARGRPKKKPMLISESILYMSRWKSTRQKALGKDVHRGARSRSVS